MQNKVTWRESTHSKTAKKGELVSLQGIATEKRQLET